MITMSSRPLRILVVDDDPAMVGAITALVGTEGHQVITAYDGLTAVKRFRDPPSTQSSATEAEPRICPASVNVARTPGTTWRSTPRWATPTTARLR